MTSTQKTKSNIMKTTRMKSDSKIIMMMIILLILNMMLMTLMTDVAYVIIVEVWVVTTDVRYPIIMMLSVKLNLKFGGKYDPDAYISWEIAVDQKFACHEFPENTRVRAANSEFTNFATIWWIEHGKKNPNSIP